MESTFVIDKWGNKIWRNSLGQLHREDGPAIEYANGFKTWYLNGKRHRLNGPAIECFDINWTKEWWVDGVRQSFPIETFVLLKTKRLIDLD